MPSSSSKTVSPAVPASITGAAKARITMRGARAHVLGGAADVR